MTYSKTKTRSIPSANAVVSDRIIQLWPGAGVTHSYNYVKVPDQSDKISYETGPIYVQGHCNWKPCVHETRQLLRGVIGTSYGRKLPSGYALEAQVCNPIAIPGTPVAPKAQWDKSVLEGIIGQIDLNCSESVMVYSGLLQAIPLVGAATKLSSIVNQAGRKILRSLRNKPFTSAIKLLIQGDFVNRFVIGPTIQDAKMFNDACNYVIRVMNTARERTGAPTALQASKTTIVSETLPETKHIELNNTHFWYEQTRVRSITSKAFARLDLDYDWRAINPIYLWASRTGMLRPFDSAWDLVPFSFVIDYFTRAGDFISGIGDTLTTQGALTGKITKIHDLWGSVLSKDEYRLAGTGARPDYFKTDFVFQKSVETYESSYYERFPISNPGEFLSSLEESETLFQSSISLTKLRTIAELIIQAKL